MPILLRSLITVILCGFGFGAAAHEFWIEPLAYQVQVGDEIKAELRLGQKFDGSSYPFNDRRIARFELVQGGQTEQVTGRLGDDPALSMPARADGLAIVVHETTEQRTHYREIEKFETFVTHKDLKGTLEENTARGFGDGDFGEAYKRYIKALIAVGDGMGSDRVMGLHTEIVALANPYTEALSELPVRVFLEGAPRADVQVELFRKAPDGGVTITLHRTDKTGLAHLPLTPGHAYFADAVSIEALPNDDPETGPVWRTHWAGLTFYVPQ